MFLFFYSVLGSWQKTFSIFFASRTECSTSKCQHKGGGVTSSELFSKIFILFNEQGCHLSSLYQKSSKCYVTIKI